MRLALFMVAVVWLLGGSAGHRAAADTPPAVNEPAPDDKDAQPTCRENPRYCRALSLSVENDLFGDGSDRHFTNGIRFGYLFPLDGPPRLARWLARFIPSLRGPGATYRTQVSLAQNLFTPDDILATGLIVDDRPYAAWLFSEVGLASVHDKRLEAPSADSDTILRQDNFIVSLGMIGPAALGRQVQRWWHGVIGVDKPRGWQNQLRNEPALLLLYERSWVIRPRVAHAGRFGVDFMPKAGAALGNVFVYGAAGGVMRVGWNLPDDFGVPQIRPSLPGNAYFEPPEGGLSAYLFFGGEGRIVGRNIFLDGNTFRNSHSVAKEVLVADMTAGGVIAFGGPVPFRISYNFIFRTREFKLQKNADKFGSITLSLLF